MIFSKDKFFLFFFNVLELFLAVNVIQVWKSILGCEKIPHTTYAFSTFCVRLYIQLIIEV